MDSVQELEGELPLEVTILYSTTSHMTVCRNGPPPTALLQPLYLTVGYRTPCDNENIIYWYEIFARNGIKVAASFKEKEPSLDDKEIVFVDRIARRYIRYA